MTSKCLKTFRKIFRIVFWQNMSLQNEINLWFLLNSKFIYFASQVKFISSFIERFNAKECLGVASLLPRHKFVAKFWLTAINTTFQVCFLKLVEMGLWNLCVVFQIERFISFFLSIVVFLRLWLGWGYGQNMLIRSVLSTLAPMLQGKRRKGFTII